MLDARMEIYEYLCTYKNKAISKNEVILLEIIQYYLHIYILYLLKTTSFFFPVFKISKYLL